MLTVVLWNLAWRRAGSPAGEAARAIIAAADADLICLTEASRGLLPPGHIAAAPAFPGPRRRPDDHKVLLWSRSPWQEVDPVGHPALPQARFVRATTQTPLGAVEATGVCIPWADAHVATGRRDRRRWEEHGLYLEALGAILSNRPARPRELLLGDFNQAIPRRRAPRPVYEQLMSVIGERFILPTAGPQPGFPLAVIDHLAHSPDLTCTRLAPLSNATGDGRRISDHVGMRLEFTERQPTSEETGGAGARPRQPFRESAPSPARS
ncbi:endonuclease/exonuclease/phosphatase family protein [Ancylobacter terrae]|uniref:endonuclease/exonuclease/phosphatase family protein n=1 Tax=Ancylobacter sp. sgz301288 TaxID=3342077 RepID=UPI00385C6663